MRVCLPQSLNILVVRYLVDSNVSCHKAQVKEAAYGYHTTENHARRIHDPRVTDWGADWGTDWGTDD